jgi:hypothetical protein
MRAKMPRVNSLLTRMDGQTMKAQTAARIIRALDTHFCADADAARALSLTRQAYALAKRRQSLSDAVCIRACAVLNLDPSPTLAALHRDQADTPETRAAWEKILQRLTRNPDSDQPTDNGNENTNENTNEAVLNNNQGGIQIMRFTETPDSPSGGPPLPPGTLQQETIGRNPGVQAVPPA